MSEKTLFDLYDLVRLANERRWPNFFEKAWIRDGRHEANPVAHAIRYAQKRRRRMIGRIGSGAVAIFASFAAVAAFHSVPVGETVQVRTLFGAIMFIGMIACALAALFSVGRLVGLFFVKLPGRVSADAFCRAVNFFFLEGHEVVSVDDLEGLGLRGCKDIADKILFRKALEILRLRPQGPLDIGYHARSTRCMQDFKSAHELLESIDLADTGSHKRYFEEAGRIAESSIAAPQTASAEATMQGDSAGAGRIGDVAPQST